MLFALIALCRTGGRDGTEGVVSFGDTPKAASHIVVDIRTCSVLWAESASEIDGEL